MIGKLLGRNVKWLLVMFLILSSLLGWRFWVEARRILSMEVTSWSQDHSADCAVVLTGKAGRVREGFDLLSQNQIQKLIISGVFPRASLEDIFKEWPYYGNVSEEDVILEKRSGSTYGNAQQTLPLVEALRCRDLILVTSRIHMYRSLRIFKSVFPKRFPIYPRSTVYGHYHPEFFQLLDEVFKSLFYSLWAY